MFESKDMLDKSIAAALETFERHCALVKVINSEEYNANSDKNFNKDWNFFLRQLQDPIHVRPVKKLSDSVNRGLVLNPRTMEWRGRIINKKRGAEKNTPYIKKTSFTLAPPNGRIELFRRSRHVGIVVDYDECKIKPKYIWPKNAFSNKKWWIANNADTSDTMIATTIEKLRQQNMAAVKAKKDSVMNEVLACPQKSSLRAIAVTLNDRTSRLNGICRQEQVSDELKLNLPILIMASNQAVTVYPIEKQISDIIYAFNSLNTLERKLAHKICLNLKSYIDKHIHLLTYCNLAEVIHALIVTEKFDIATKLLESCPNQKLDYQDSDTKNSSLHYAIEADQPRLVELLSRAKVECARINSIEKSSLRLACDRQQYEMMKSMLDHAGCHYYGNHDLALIIADLLENNQIEIINSIFERFKIDIISKFSKTDKNRLLFLAVKFDHGCSLVSHLLDAGACADYINTTESALMLAIVTKKMAYIELMTKKGILLNFTAENIDQLIRQLIKIGQYDCAIEMINNLNNNQKNHSWHQIQTKNHLIKEAVNRNHWELAHLLLKKNLRFSWKNTKLYIPLQEAIENGQDAILQTILANGNLYQFSNNDLGIAFFNLIKKSKLELAEKLFDIRPYLYIQTKTDENNKTATHLVLLSNRISLIKKLYSKKNLTHDGGIRHMRIYSEHYCDNNHFKESIENLCNTNIRTSRHNIAHHLHFLLNTCSSFENLLDYYKKFNEVSKSHAGLKSILKRQSLLGVSLRGHQVAGQKTSNYHTMIIKMFKIRALQLLLTAGTTYLITFPKIYQQIMELLSMKRYLFNYKQTASLRIFKLTDNTEKENEIAEQEQSLNKWKSHITAAAA